MAPEDPTRETLAFSLEQAVRAGNLALAVVVLIAVMAAREAAVAVATGWAAMAALALLGRNALLARVGEALSQPRGQARARAMLNGSSLALALVLGALPLVIFPAMGTELRLLLTLFFCVWCAAGMSSLGATPHLYAGYLAIVLGCIALGWFRSGSASWGYVAAGVAMYGLVLRAFSAGFAKRVAEGIAIRAQNADLVRQLSLANEAKTRFIMAASHDLRQPLHAISLLGGVLSRAQTPDDARNARDALESAVNGLDTLFSSILDLSRLESGMVRVNASPFDVGPLVARLDAEYRELCLSNGRRWACQVERAVVETDATLLERILRNLLDNAVKHGGAGAIQLAVEAGPGTVAVRVSDTGPGIPAAERDRVFEEFYRVGDATQPGLGLGLSIVRRLAGILGCRLELGFTDPVARTGASFTLHIPASLAPVLPGATPAGLAAEPDVDGLAILAMDDEPAVLEATRSLLRQWGCRVATCRGPSGLEVAIAELGRAPDVALVDYRLGPDLSGLDAIANARLRHPEMGLVVITGESDEAVLARLAESGFPVLEKPVRPQELRLTLSLFKTVAGS